MVRTVPAANVVRTVPATNVVRTVPATNLVRTVPATNLVRTVPATNLVRTVPATNLVRAVPAGVVHHTRTDPTSVVSPGRLIQVGGALHHVVGLEATAAPAATVIEA